MPPPCPGNGPAAPRANLPIANFFTSAALSGILVATLNLPGALADLIILCAAQSVDWPSLCDSGPPTFQVLTDSDIQTIQTQPFDINNISFSKLVTLVQIGMWYYGCECTGAATPPPPAIPTPGPSSPITNFPLPPGQVTGPCSDITLSQQQVTPTPATGTPVDVTPTWLPGTLVTGLPVHQYGQTAGWTIPPTCQSIHFTGTFNNSLGTSLNSTYNFFTWNADKTRGTSLNISGVRPGTFDVEWVRSSTDAYYLIDWQDDAPPNTVFNLTMRAQMACSGAGAIVQPCCPPDPTLTGLIQQLLNIATADHKLVTLIQRYGTPFAYNLGATHLSLQGTGSFPVQSLLGMRATVLTHPADNPQFTGNPPYIMDLGWLSVETGDGFIDEIRLTRTTQLWMSRLFQTGVTFGYALRAGVVVTFTELQAEA